MLIGREEKQDLSHAKVGGVDLREHFGETKGVRWASAPGIADTVGIKARQTRKRIEISGEQLHELGRAATALVPC